MATTTNIATFMMIDGYVYPLGTRLVNGKIVYPDEHSEYYDAGLLTRKLDKEGIDATEPKG